MNNTQIGDLAGIAVAFVIGFVVLGFGAKILSDVGTSLTGSAAQVTGNATTGMVTLGAYAPTIAVVVAGALVIGILINSFTKAA